ncbi:RidA family protein [Dielma fastidiosa]|uniref:2-iminobutanoate/2-iminopropanoate deaminase n=1 Tax=Dielma fastidiosa TaxID=1034346 RepID=A0A318KV25_9FIRM|nr:RidA family protein [Dielma fastidiosa]PXX81764.1 2-iminobutanoate/2-iminopropanoate deaminase [Dielma fastidiosa]
MDRIISTEKAPAAIGPYSQAMKVGNMLFASGQIPVDPATNEIAGTTIEEQAQQVMKNVCAILEASAMSVEDVVKTTCFLADMKDFAAFNKIYGDTFTSWPARSCVAVREIPKGVLCEVEIIAVKR